MSWLERLRTLIEEQYRDHPTGCGGSFGELLCYELHSAEHNDGRGLTFTQLAEKWGVSVPTIGMLIADHCNRMEEEPVVNHGYGTDAIPKPPVDLVRELARARDLIAQRIDPAVYCVDGVPILDHLATVLAEKPV